MRVSLVSQKIEPLLLGPIRKGNALDNLADIILFFIWRIINTHPLSCNVALLYR